MSPAPRHEFILEHGEQPGRDSPELSGFRDDFVAADEFVRKPDVHRQADLGVTRMGRRIAAITDRREILSETLRADVTFRTDADDFRSLPKSVLLLVREQLILRYFDRVGERVNEQEFSFHHRRFDFGSILPNGRPGVLNPHESEELALRHIREVVDDTVDIPRCQKRIDVFEIVEELRILAGDEGLIEEAFRAAGIDFEVEPASRRSARGADRVQFDAADVAIAANVILDPEAERFSLARAAVNRG